MSGESDHGQSPKTHDNTSSPTRIPHSDGKTETQLSQMRNETEKGEDQKGKWRLLDGKGRQSLPDKVDSTGLTVSQLSHRDPPQGRGPKPETEINLSGREGNAAGLRSLQSMSSDEILGEI